MLILANIIVVLQYLLDFLIGYKYNKKSTILKGNMLTSSMSVASSLMLGATAGAVSSVITIIRLAIIYIKDKYNKRFIIPFVLLCIMYLSVLFEHKGYETILLVISNFFSFIPKWFSRNPQHLRMGGLMSNICIIPYFLLVHNYTGTGFAVFNIVTIAINLIKWHICKEI